MKKGEIVFLLLASFLVIQSCKEDHYTGPLTPEEALKSFTLNEDFEIEIFAAEPYVKDPIDLIFDEEGNAFAVEMNSYPYATDPGAGTGIIKALIDTNKDGRIDKSIVFADSLSEATSLLSWKGGLLVTASPDILFLKDTNGDFRADIRRRLFSGFFKGNSEAQITALRFSVDNWVYATNYGEEGNVGIPGKDASTEISLTGADFRFRLDREQFEPETGIGQFGQTIDEYGHRFITQNSLHIAQAVIPWRYLHRHTELSSFNAVDISDHDQLMHQATPAPYWRAERTNQRNKAFQEQRLDRIEYASGHFTGSAGGIIYGSNVFPAKYQGNFFVGDVAGNLVHRDVLVLKDSSPLYNASRSKPDDQGEFLISSDPWFRPVNFSIGPDGALYLVDMYRQHIETPFAIPEELKKDMDFKNGSEMGRIYRIVPKGGLQSKGDVPNFRRMASSELLGLLTDPNPQTRLQAQKMLLERQDTAIIPAVRALFFSKDDIAGRLNILYALEGLGALNEAVLSFAIANKQPEVREAGVRLAEGFPKCRNMILQAAKDSVAQVVFQACLSVGNLPFADAGPALADALARYGRQEWFRKAVLSSVPGSSLEFLALLSKAGWFRDKGHQEREAFLESFAIITGRKTQPEQLRFIDLISLPPFSSNMEYQQAALIGYVKGLQKDEPALPADPILQGKLNNIIAGLKDEQFRTQIAGEVKSVWKGKQ